MNLSSKAGSSRLLRALPATALCGAVLAAAMATGGAAGASPRHSDPCSGTNTTVGSDYSFVGSGQPGVTYVVDITLPNGNSFAPTVTADATGSWTETWYANMSGLYSAAVSLYKNGQPVASCSLTVS